MPHENVVDTRVIKSVISQSVWLPETKNYIVCLIMVLVTSRKEITLLLPLLSFLCSCFRSVVIKVSILDNEHLWNKKYCSYQYHHTIYNFTHNLIFLDCISWDKLAAPFSNFLSIRIYFISIEQYHQASNSNST